MITFKDYDVKIFTDDVEEISVLNKYAVTGMYISSDWNCKNDFYIKDLNQAFDYSKLQYLKVELNTKKLVSLDIERLDLSSISILLLGNSYEPSLVMNNMADNIYGEITTIGDADTINLSICGTKVKLNLSLWNGKTMVPNIMYSGAYGDIANFSAINSAFRLNLHGTKGIYGDLSKLPNCYLVTTNSSNINDNTFTWTSKGSSMKYKNILKNVHVTSGLDQYFIDMATLPNSSETSEKSIIIKGTRTSASDSAVQTLQSQGYTIQVINE